MSFQTIIRPALLSVIALCGCSTGSLNVPKLSNPFAAVPFGSKAEKPPTQFAMSSSGQPKQRASALDWFRRSGTDEASPAQSASSLRALLNPQSTASQQAPLPVYSQASPALAQTSQPMAAMQTAAVRSPFVNQGNVAPASAPSSNVYGQYGATTQYMPSPQSQAQYPVTAPYAAAAQNPGSTSKAASYGAPTQPMQQYTSPVQAQYSTASQNNAPQYTQPAGYSGSSFR